MDGVQLSLEGPDAGDRIPPRITMAAPVTQESVEAREVPCVVCGERPSVAFCYGPPLGSGLRHGRVCKAHAREAADAGIGVAYRGGVKNWGSA